MRAEEPPRLAAFSLNARPKRAQLRWSPARARRRRDTFTLTTPLLFALPARRTRTVFLYRQLLRVDLAGAVPLVEADEEIDDGGGGGGDGGSSHLTRVWANI